MTNSRMLVLIFLVWIAERLAQSVFFYNFSLAVPLLISLAFFAIRLKILPWPLFAGGVIFDLSSGLPFGAIILPVAAICLLISLSQKLLNLFNSLPLFLFTGGIFSLVAWAVVIWLSEIPFRIFSGSAAIVAIETILILLALNLYGKPRFQQI